MTGLQVLRRLFPKKTFKENNAFGYFKVFTERFNELRVKKIYTCKDRLYILIRNASDFYNNASIMLSCKEFQVTFKKHLYCSIYKRTVGFGWLVVFEKHC